MFNHVTVLLNEAVEGLNVKSDGIYVDCTLGGAGHSSLILKQLTTGHLYCFDQDENAIQAARQRLETIGKQFTIIQSNFKNIKAELNQRGVEHVDGILFDLGVSSPQFDNAERGFSYNYDARLDMRMDQSSSLDAHEIVNHYSYEQLVEILYKYADEKFAKQIARRIEKEREIQPIDTTFQLVEIVKSAIPAYARRKGGHPAKRTFQALRIAVNDELNVFDIALKDALDLLNINGRIAVITFHSLEDKICKYTFNDVSKLKDVPKGLPVIPEEMQPKFKLINKKPIIATEEELNEIQGVGEVLAKAFTGYFSDAKHVENFRKLLEELTIPEETSTKKQIFEGVNFVITGSVTHFANRGEVKELIESLGGKVTGSVTSKTNYLINNDVTSTSSKNKKANELGIPIISEETFLELVNQEES